jgi:MYXO-CTERM domain-containing protein
MADGRFTGTQTAISVDVPAVPEPAVWALWLGGLAVLLAWATQNRRHVQRQRGDPACNPS